MKQRALWLGCLFCGLTALVIALSVSMNARADDKKPQPPELPKVFDDLDDLFKDLPEGIDKEQLKKMLEMRKQMFQNLPNFKGGFGGQLGMRQQVEGRLGVQAVKPSDALADQLDLPKDQGLVIEEVVKDSAAAKAGLKAHDILLEVDGKPVANDPREFKKSLDNVKADAVVDMVVLRKGKKETIKGVKLPEAKVEKPALGGFGPNFPNFPNVPNGPGAHKEKVTNMLKMIEK
jgi:membrane-associated protease RseP (regulator of RpoE activity)